MADSLWHSNVESDPGRRAMFETLVLIALWTLIRCAFGARPYVEAMNLRTSIIDYMDVHSPNKRPEGRDYRRKNEFAELPIEKR